MPEFLPMTPSCRAVIAAYVASGDHIDRGRAKPLRQIARELRMSSTTVGRWLKQNHPDLWQTYWTATHRTRLAAGSAQRSRQAQA